MKIKKATKTGFCYGVRRAVEILEKVAEEDGGIESLGDIVHNEQVMSRLIAKGVKVIRNINEITGNKIAIGAHGVAPETTKELNSRGIEIIDTTCPFVRRAQNTAKRLSEAGFFVIVYGDKEHAEIKGILGWAGSNGVATTNAKYISKLNLPTKIGILSQTTQIPEKFQQFTTTVFNKCFSKDSEICIIDTICHDIRDRQKAALKLAKNVDVMVVIGGKNSANTMHLAKLCDTVVTTHKIASAEEIKTTWFRTKQQKIGITTGSSTADETLEEVTNRLESILSN